ncbi:hypothetical protein AgCh_032840 [Apium graveolens]
MAAQSLRFSLSLFSPTPITKQLQPTRITPKPYLHISKPIKYAPIRSEITAPSTTPLVSNGALVLKPGVGELELGPVIEIDRVVESDLKENGFRGTRKTKIVCTIGPATCGFDELEALAIGGMNVARLNMCHGTHEWHKSVIEKIRRLNVEKGFGVSIMMDTQGSEVHMGDLAGGASSAKVEDGDVWTFTVRSYESELPERTVNVNYDGFAEDVYIGDELIVDGGMARFEVIQKIGPDVKCICTDPGLLLPRANLTFWRDGRLVQERNAMLPTISAKDWLDIDFGLSEGVDFIAVSFVKSAEVINHLKKYLASHPHDSGTYVISKIENVDSLKNLDTIIKASDGVMVARGDLGAQIPLEQVPSVQKKIVEMCRELNKPVIVASQLLESMIEYPIPTRAEVADVTEAIKQQADALMLSGESAMGQYPFKALSVLRSISLRIEKWWREENSHRPRKLPVATFTSPNIVTNELCTAAASMGKFLCICFLK